MSLYPMNSCLKSCEYATKWEPIVVSGELASAFTHQFSTKPYCAVTGFSEYQVRKYRPEIGRWMCRDVITPLKYVFCYNRNSYIDILGHVPVNWPYPYHPGFSFPSLPDPWLNLPPYDPPNESVPPIFVIQPFPAYGGTVIPIDEGTDDCDCPEGSKKGKRQNHRNYVKIDKKCTAKTGDNPAGFPDTSFSSACIAHDNCYASCNQTKWNCDDAFRQDLQNLCDSVAKKRGPNSPDAKLCYLWAAIYLVGVQNFGDSMFAGSQSWSNLQKDACMECCCD